MPYLPGKLPFRGWITDSPYSAVPDGFSASMLNVMPNDTFRRRVRLGTRPASNRAYSFPSTQNIQCMLRTISFNNATTPPTRRDRIIIVAGGKFYYMDQGGVAPVQITHFDSNTSYTSAILSSTVSRIGGVQRGKYAYFCDGSGTNGYVKVDLQSSTLQITYWHHGSHGPEDHVKAVVGANTYTANLISTFGARIVLSGVKTLENVWYMSNIQDPDDWNPSGSDDDAQAGTTGTIGPVGDEIVAMAPFGTSGFLMAGKRSVAYLTSDPAYDPTGARIATLSKSIGVVGPKALCEGPEKSLYLLGQDGLYRIRPNDFNLDRGSLISLNKLDSFFSGLKYDLIDPVLHYDVERRGVWIFLTRTDAPQNSTHLFYSEQVDGFFPIRLYDPLFYGASFACQAAAYDGRNQVMLCAYKNTISMFDQRFVSGCDGFPASGYTSATTPSESSRPSQLISSTLNIGPIQPLQPELVLAKELQVELASDEYIVPNELKSGGTSIASRPRARLLGADTPQESIAEEINSITVNEGLSVTYDCGGPVNSETPISGGTASSASPLYADGGYAPNTFGTYIAQDSLQSPNNRKYYSADGLLVVQRQAFETISPSLIYQGNWYQIKTSGDTPWTSLGAPNGTVGTVFKATITAEEAGIEGTGFAYVVRWVIKYATNSTVNSTSASEVVLYGQQHSSLTPVSEDIDKGTYLWLTALSGGPEGTFDSSKTASITAAFFVGAEANVFGYLREGINNRMRCRLRYGAMYVEISSTGWPWAIERVAIDAEPISRRRTIVDVSANE